MSKGRKNLERQVFKCHGISRSRLERLLRDLFDESEYYFDRVGDEWHVVSPGIPWVCLCMKHNHPSELLLLLSYDVKYFADGS